MNNKPKFRSLCLHSITPKLQYYISGSSLLPVGPADHAEQNPKLEIRLRLGAKTYGSERSPKEIQNLNSRLSRGITLVP